MSPVIAGLITVALAQTPGSTPHTLRLVEGATREHEGSIERPVTVREEMVVYRRASSSARQVTNAAAKDLRVIDAALDHKARTAERGPRVLFLVDRTIEPCAGQSGGMECFLIGEKTLTFLRRKIPELTQERLQALAARNAVAQVLQASPARDVIVIPRENLAAAMKERDANVSAFTSLPVYFDDDTALLFLGYVCGRLCGEGTFILLRRGADGWKVERAAMTWIS